MSSRGVTMNGNGSCEYFEPNDVGGLQGNEEALSDGMDTAHMKSKKSKKGSGSTEENISPHKTDMEAAREKLDQLEEEGRPLVGDGERDNDIDVDDHTDMEQKVTMYNISTDGINKKYSQKSTWKKVSRNKEEDPSSPHRTDLEGAKERSEQLKSVHEEEGISLEEEVEHDNERDGDNVQQKVTMYNISTDGINKKYHQQSTWKKVRRHKEETTGGSHLSDIEEAKERLQKLKSSVHTTDEGLSLEEENERDGDDYDQYDHNVEQKVTMYNLSTDGINTNYSEKIVLDRKITALEREQTLMMQEEMVMMEAKLKDLELKHHHVLRELNTLKETVIEREKICIDQKNEIGELQKDIAQLEETNTYHKESAVEAAKRIGEVEEINNTLNMEVSSLRIQIRDARAHTSRANIRVKIADRKVSQMEEIAANARQKLLDCRRELDAEVTKREAMEDECREHEAMTQEDVEHAKLHAKENEEKYEELEKMSKRIIREKDKTIFDLQKVADRVPSLEEHIRDLEKENSAMGISFKELSDTVIRYIRKDTAPSQNNTDPSIKQFIMIGSTIGSKRSGTDNVKPEEVENYFKEAHNEKQMLKDEIMALTYRLKKEQKLGEDLSETIPNLQGELKQVEMDLGVTTKSREAIQKQYEEAKNIIELQMRKCEGKNEEVKRLQNLLHDAEMEINRLKEEQYLYMVGAEERKEHEGYEKNKKEEETTFLLNTIEDYKSQLAKLHTHIATCDLFQKSGSAAEGGDLARQIDDLEQELRKGNDLSLVDEKRNKEEEAEKIMHLHEMSNSSDEVIQTNEDDPRHEVKVKMKTAISQNLDLAEHMVTLQLNSESQVDAITESPPNKYGGDVKFQMISTSNDGECSLTIEIEMAELRGQIEALTRRHHERNNDVEERFITLEGRVKSLEGNLGNDLKKTLVSALLYD